MGRKGNIWLLMGTYFATWLSSVTFLGLAGMAWDYGPVTVQFIWWAGPIGILLFTYLIGPQLRRGGYLTVPDFFEERFASRRIRIYVSLVLLASLLVYAISGLIGAGIVFSAALGTSYSVGVFIFAIIVIVFVFLGGMWGVVFGDLVLFILLTVAALIIFPITMLVVGGWDVAFHTMASDFPQMFTVLGYSGVSPFWMFGYTVTWMVLVCCSPHLVNRTLIAKDSKTSVYALVLGLPIAMVLVTFINHSYGAFNVLVPRGTMPLDDIGPYFVKSYFPTWFAVIFYIGITAAVVSTTNTQIITAATHAARDIYKAVFNPNISDSALVWVTRLMVPLCGAFVVAIALMRPGYIAVISNLAGLVIGSAFFPQILAALWWRRVTAKAIEWSMLLGLIWSLFVLFTNLFLNWFLPHPIVYTIPFGVLLMVVITYCTSKTPEEEEAWRQLKPKLHPQVRAEEVAASEYAVPLVGLVITLATIVFILGLWLGWWI